MSQPIITHDDFIEVSLQELKVVYLQDETSIENLEEHLPQPTIIPLEWSSTSMTIQLTFLNPLHVS